MAMMMEKSCSAPKTTFFSIFNCCSVVMVGKANAAATTTRAKTARNTEDLPRRRTSQVTVFVARVQMRDREKDGSPPMKIFRW